MDTYVDNILKFDKQQEDYYALLGCDETSTEEQINTEYKVRALMFHPDKNDGDKSKEALFQKLKEAKEVLCDAEQRRNYDKWRNSGIAITYKNWKEMKDHIHQSLHWAKVKTDERMLESGTSENDPAENLLQAPTVPRRASEGGVNIYTAPKGTFKWTNQPSSDVISKFRNYEI